MPSLTPNVTGTRPAVSRGQSEYNALILVGRRRLSHGLDFTASYTLSKGKSTIGNAADELNTANIQDPNNPFDDPRQFGAEPDDRRAAPVQRLGACSQVAVGHHASRRSSSSARRCRST